MGVKLVVIKFLCNMIGLNCGWLVKRFLVFMDKNIFIRVNF